MDIFDDDFGISPENLENEDDISFDSNNVLQNTSNLDDNLTIPENEDFNDDIRPNVPDDVFAGGLDELDTSGKEQIDILSTNSVPFIGEVYGVPEADLEHWHLQERGDSCAIVSQEFILESFYPDQDFTETELVDKAEIEGYYTPGGGTYPWHVGELLEDYGVNVERSYDNSIDDITEKLRANKKIIVGVDGNEVWTNSPDEFIELNLIDLFYYPEANHAVEVIGIDTDKQEIILNDPGHPEGRGMHVPFDQFQLAWNDSKCFLMSTVESPPMTTT